MRVTHPSATLVAWGNAWLTGHVGLDEAADSVERRHGPHVVTGVPGEPGEVPLRRGLGALRLAGVTAFRLSLPAPGDPLGLTGPASFNANAIEAGEAVLADFSRPATPGSSRPADHGLDGRSLGLIPAEDRRGSSYVGTRWTAHETHPGIADIPPLPEADHRLTLAVRDATESLLATDGSRDWRPEIAGSLTALRESRQDGLAPGYPARAHRVAALASRLAAVVDLVRTTEGFDRRRAEALRSLDMAVRRARVAACNSVLDPVR